MKILQIPSPDEDAWTYLENKLLAFNGSRVDGYGYENIVFTAVEQDDAVIAGIHGQIGGGWLYIVSLWVEADYRGQGLGQQLLRKAELSAIEKGCHDAYLYTYSFQNPRFYEHCGYRVFGQLDNFCGSHAKYYMKKELV